MVNNHTPKPPTDEVLAWIKRNWEVFPTEGRVESKTRSDCEDIGSINAQGYVSISVTGTHIRIRRSHLVWYIVYGVWPTTMLDHKNRIRTDDRIDNLQESTEVDNASNRPTSGKFPKGVRVTRNKSNPYAAQITRNGKTRGLGYFKTPEEAHVRYLEELEKVDG